MVDNNYNSADCAVAVNGHGNGTTGIRSRTCGNGSSGVTNNNATNHDDQAQYYRFDFGKLDDKLFRYDVPIEKWLDDACTSTSSKKGFPDNSLNVVDDIPLDVEIERLIGISWYMFGNVFPFFMMIFSILFLLPFDSINFNNMYIRYAFYAVVGYVGGLGAIEGLISKNYFVYYKYKQKKYLFGGEKNIKYDQYEFSQRNQCKYISLKYVWPKALHRPNIESQNVIYCLIPHGVAPFGVPAYSVWSKVWNSNLCRWTIAPVVLKLPLVGYFCKCLGCIPAKSSSIYEAINKRNENVGVVLDGISGMFQLSSDVEIATILNRKGIIKIALRCGVPIVPVYAFGHTSLYKIIVDPFGILEYLSNALGVSITPFYGRFGWLLGPPWRVPVVVCLGDPINCPKIDHPTQEDIDKYHAQLLQAYQDLFNTHKAAYGWGHKSLKFV